MVQANGTGDNYNVASFFMLKLLPPQNGTPAIEQKTDKKGGCILFFMFVTAQAEVLISAMYSTIQDLQTECSP